MNESLENLRASILDKLIDQEPEKTAEPASMRLSSVAEIKNAVIRDIENLLNTRQTARIPPPALEKVGRSLYTYGLRDFTTENPSSVVVAQKIRREISQTLTLFEPRLKNLVVHFEESRGNNRNLHFRISGMLVITPLAEPVVFDTQFDSNRGEYRIAQ